MGETDYPATEQAAAHPGSSPRTLERYGARGRPVSPAAIARTTCAVSTAASPMTRAVAVESEDECGRDGHGMDASENKFCCSEST